jgi:hypothetical protein
MKFRFSGVLLRFVDYRREVEVEGSTLGEGIDSLLTQFPKLQSVLIDGQGKVQSAHRLFLRGEPVKMQDRDLRVEKNDSIEVLTTIAGG